MTPINKELNNFRATPEGLQAALLSSKYSPPFEETALFLLGRLFCNVIFVRLVSIAGQDIAGYR
ncbi:MAG: hypothetical protein DRP64_19890, partial [Verrucomicrobia bacterium]